MISPDPDALDQKERRQYRSTVRFVSIVLQALAFVGLLAWGLFTKAPPVKAGTPAPQFELELFSGAEVLISDIQRDRMFDVTYPPSIHSSSSVRQVTYYAVS